MKTENLIATEEICAHHDIEFSFIRSLQEMGLIELHSIKESSFVQNDQLPLLEKYIEFHYVLNINLEGIETINHLLGQINTLQKEVNTLKNRLHFYESHE
jgi:hypothetical protein